MVNFHAEDEFRFFHSSKWHKNNNSMQRFLLSECIRIRSSGFDPCVPFEYTSHLFFVFIDIESPSWSHSFLIKTSVLTFLSQKNRKVNRKRQNEVNLKKKSSPVYSWAIILVFWANKTKWFIFCYRKQSQSVRNTICLKKGQETKGELPIHQSNLKYV